MLKRIIMLIILVIVFSGCNLKDTDIRLTKNEYRKATDLILETLIDALENDDKQSIKNLFAVNVQEKSQSLDIQIDEMIEYFDGDVISYDKVSINAEGKSVDDGVITYYRIGNARTGKVITSESTYIISFSTIIIDEDNKDNEGVWRIWIGKDKEDYMIVGISDMPLAWSEF